MRPVAKRIVLSVLAGLALAALLAVAFWPEAIPVDFVAVDRGPLTVSVSEEGKTQVREVYVVSAPVAGRVLRVERHAGDAVVAEETVLAMLVPSTPAFLDQRTQAEVDAAAKAAEAARELAAAEVAQAEAAVAFANAEYARAAALDAGGNIAKSALDRALLEQRSKHAALDQARAALTMRAFELETARARQMSPRTEARSGNGGCCLELHAPISGRILRVLRESEGEVAGGAPLFEIGDPGDLEVLVELLSEDALRIREGAAVTIEAGAGLVLSGRVRRIEPHGHTKVSALGIEEQRVNTLISLNQPRPDGGRLGHGFRVQTRIEVWRTESAVRVPIGALFRTGETWAVFAAEDGRARQRAITLGNRNTTHAVVETGLVPGERVILHPSDRVADGVRVIARETP